MRFSIGDAGEVNAGDDREEAEDVELEIRDVGLESVVEPAAEVVIAGAGVGVTEEGGDLEVDFGFVEDGERGGGGGDGEGGVDDGGERLDGGLDFFGGVWDEGDGGGGGGGGGGGSSFVGHCG